MTMNQQLAHEYGTPGAAASSDEDMNKQAEVELFVKLAAENQIDLNQLGDEQIATLWENVFGKTAQDETGDDEKKEGEPPFPPKKDEKKEEEKEEEEKKQAAAELAAKRAWNDEQAKADFLGRKMAHALVSELNAIGEAQDGTKEASALPDHLARALGRAGADATGTVKTASGQGSAIDHLAIKRAADLARESGLDPEEARTKVAAVHTLGLLDNKDSKTASASDVEAAVHIRALEFLEAAGYPVDWK